MQATTFLGKKAVFAILLSNFKLIFRVRINWSD